MSHYAREQVTEKRREAECEYMIGWLLDADALQTVEAWEHEAARQRQAVHSTAYMLESSTLQDEKKALEARLEGVQVHCNYY